MVEAEYLDVQAESDGLVIQLPMLEASLLRLVSALYTPVQLLSDGVVMQLLRTVTSVVRLETPEVMAGMVAAPL